MAGESLQSSSSSSSLVSPSPSPSPASSTSPAVGNNAGESFIGSFISLISKYEIRYEGVLYHFNIQDSTLGLKNVRSFGTEGRKKDGPQIPPSDTLYDYILFRGSDIKDLQVKCPPSALSKQEIQSDLNITQSRYSQPAMISSLSGPDSSCSLVRPVEWMDTPAMSSRPFPSTQQLPVPSSFFPSSSVDVRGLTESPPTLIGPSGNFQATQNNFVSSMPMPSFVHGNKAASASSCLATMHKPVSSPTTMHNQPHITGPDSSPIMGLVNDTSHLVTRAPHLPANPPYFNSSPLAQPQLSAPNSLSQFPASIQSSCPTGSQFAGKVVYHSAFGQPAPYELPGVTPNLVPVNPSPLFTSPPSFLGMEQLLQSRDPAFSPGKIVSGGGEMVATTKPISVDVLSRGPATVNQAPLLPLPVSVQQSQKPSSSIQFTEEFDFEAMNEKFKKNEMWGFLGNNNQRNQTDDREGTAIELSSERKAKPAYKKDDFFDTISRNTLNRVARSGHSHFAERVRHQNAEGPQLQPGDGGYLTAHGGYRVGHNAGGAGYGYYGGRGDGKSTHY